MTKYLKSTLCLLLALAMLFGVVGCNGKKPVTDASSDTAQTIEPDDTSSLPETDDPAGEETPETDPTDDFWADSDEDDEQDDPMEEVDASVDFDPSLFDSQYVLNGSAPITKNFRGVNAVHLAFDYMPDPYGDRELTDKEVTTLYDRFAKMGVNQIRTFYASAMVWDYTAGAFNWNTTDTNKPINENLKGFYRSLKELQKRDIEIGMAPHWSLASLTDDKAASADHGKNATTFYAHGIYVPNDFNQTMKNYQKFMEDTVLNMEAQGIHNVKYWLAFTECNNIYGYDLEARHYEKVYPVYDAAITALDQALKNVNRRNAYKIAGPCDNYGGDFDYSDPEAYSLLTEYTLKNLSDKVDIVATHCRYSRSGEYTDNTFYYNPERSMGTTKKMADKAGKEFWVDEYNAFLEDMSANGLEMKRAYLNNPIAGVALAATINGVMNMGANNVFLWQLSNIQWPNTSTNSDFENGMQINGFQPALQESAVPYNPWYSLSLLIKYIGQGEVYACDNGMDIFVSAIKRTDGEWTVVVTNYNVMETSININFEEALGNETFYRHTYDINKVQPTANATIIPASKKVKNVTTDIYDIVPGTSVSVYTTVAD